MVPKMSSAIVCKDILTQIKPMSSSILDSNCIKPAETKLREIVTKMQKFLPK